MLEAGRTYTVDVEFASTAGGWMQGVQTRLQAGTHR